MWGVLGCSQCCRDGKEIRIAVSNGDGLDCQKLLYCSLCTVLRRTTIWGREINLKQHHCRFHNHWSLVPLFHFVFCFVFCFLVAAFEQWVWLWCWNRRGTPVGLCYSVIMCMGMCMLLVRSWRIMHHHNLGRRLARASSSSSRLGLRAGYVHAVVCG